MTATSSVQDKIQLFINSHPEYEGKPLSEISSELVSAGVLTTEELGTLDSTSTFSIANKTPQKDDNVDSFEHAENTDPSQATETTETIIEHGNEVIVKKKGDELVEKVIKEKIPNSEEVKTITITYSKGKPFTKKVQSGDEVLETSLYTSETLENGEEVVAIKTMNGDGKSVEQTIAKNVDENGDYTDEDFEYRKTLYLEDDVTGSNIKVKAGSVKEVGKTKNGLVETVSDSTGEHVVSTQYNGGSVTKYDEDKLYFKRQEVADKGKITNSAEYDGKGNTYVTIRNGDGAGTITKYFNDYIKKHGLDKSRQFTTAEFEKLNKKALSTTGLQVGKKALVPTQYNANAPILTKRGTTQQAMNKYAQFAFEQTKERLASSTITETTLSKTYSSYVELAREQLTVQGVHNPSNEQVNNRANELMALNTKNGKLTALKKGAKFSVVSNQASAADVGKLKSAGLNPTFDNNAFYKKFNSLSSQDRQKVMNIISACKGMKNVDKVKAIVYENTGVNLYDTNLTVNEYGTTSAVGMNMREEFKQKMPLEYFLTKRMGLDLTSKSGREVYARLRSLPQGELDKISASQFTPEGVPNFGRSATGSISVSKNVTAKDIIGTMQTQGVELRTADEIRAERSNPRYQERQRKEQAISMLYNSVKSAYDLINDHLDELKSHMISNAGEIAFEDLKIYGVPNVVKQLASYLSNGDGTVEGLTKSIYDKRDELQKTLFQINQLRNSKNFEADYKKLTGHDYNSKDVQTYMDMKSSLKNPVTRTIKTPKQLEQMQEQAGNMFVKLVGGDRTHEAQKFKKVGETGGSVLEMAAMIYLTGGMSELGYIKNAGSAVLKATGSRALATGVRGALTLGTYTAGRESLNVIDDFTNAKNLEELTIALGERKSIILDKTTSSELFGFVGGATAQRIFTMSKGAQNFISKGFSKVFGKGAETSEKAVSNFVADSASGTGSAFKPNEAMVSAADKVLGKGAELTGSQFISKTMAGANSLNAVGKTVSLALETLTFSGVEISEQGVIALTNEIFNDESELKQAIANNTLDDYIKTKVKNAPQSVINTLKEQGINMLMLKAVSFAVGAHAANNMDGQYETLDKSKVYKTEINGETKVVVETTNGKLYCNSTADALTFLNQSMAVETMMKSAETTKPENEFEWAQKTAVTGENSKGTVTPMSDNLPVYTRANLPENAIVMPSTNLVISTATSKPIGRLEVKQTPVDIAREKGFTDEQIKMLEAKGLDINAINEYMRVGFKPVLKPIETSFDEARLDAVASSSAGVKENTSQYKPTSNPAITKRSQKEVFRINEVLTDEELSIKASDILEKVGDRYKLNKKGDEIAFKLAEQIHKVAQEAEPDIVSTIKKMGLADGERFSFRSKSVQSLHDKIQNALADSMEKGGSLTFEQALDDVRDAEGIRTIFEAKDYTSHPEVQELLQKGDEKGAVRRASELQSNDTFEALKGYIDSVADGTNDVELFKMSNYMGKDGIPYFSEEQLMTLKHYAASKGVKIPIFERVTVKEEADGTKTVEKNPKATTKVRGSGYTAFQANFRTKNGFIFEGQWRGPIVDPFAEAEHVPYDIRTGKDIIGVHTELTNIYKPIIESLAGENKISDVMFDEHTNYLTEYYEYSRKTELGFEDGKNPPKFPAGLDTRLRAENLLLLHEYVEKIKKEPEREAELRAEYESKLVQNTPENTKSLNKRQIDDIAEHLDLSKDGKYLDLVFEQYGKDIEKLLDVQTTEEHIELNKALNENYSKILNKINELSESLDPDVSAKASDILFNKILPLAERYQQIASVVDNRASVKDGYFKKEHSGAGVLGASPKAQRIAIEDYLKKNIPNTKFDIHKVDYPEGGIQIICENNNQTISVIFDAEGKTVRRSVLEQQEGLLEEKFETNNNSSKMSSTYDPSVADFKKMVSSTKEVKDNQGNLLYIEKYVESKDAPGKYNIIRTDASGREWLIGLAEHSESGNLVIEKSLQGTDGTKTDYVYSESPKGERLSVTKITDKDGNVLLNNSQKFKVIDENHFQSVENGETYDIQFSEDKIVVKKDNGETVEFKIDDRDSKLYINPNIVPLLKQLPGSILMDIDKASLAEIGVGINNVEDDNAHFDSNNNIVSISESVSAKDKGFILLHELGHMKDLDGNKRIVENEELIEIFNEELQDFKENQSSIEEAAVSYLINDGAFLGGGLPEMVAETNAFLYANNTWDLNEQRGHYLQQYFPKSFAKIAELLKDFKPKDNLATNSSSDSASGVVGAAPTTTVFDEVAFREDLKSQTKTARTNELRFDLKEVDELVELRRKHPEVDNLLNYKKGLFSQLRVDEIRFLVSYAEKKPELYNVVINNFDKLGLASATEILESRVTGAKDIKFLENIAGLKGINFRGEEAPMFSGEVMSKLTLLHQKDPVLAENLVERFKVAKDQNFLMQTIAKISPKSHSKVNELISEKETLADGTEQYALSSGQINMLMTIYEGSPEISEKLKTILKDKTIDDKTKTSFQKQLISILRETGVITSKVVRAGNGIDTAIENLNHVENPTTPEENLLSKVGVEADFVIKKYAEKYGDKSFAKFSAHTIKLLSEFNKTKHDKSYTDYVEGLLENSIDENTVLDFLSQDEAGQKNIIQNFENTKTKIKDRYFYLQSSNAKSQLTNNDIIKNLALMEIHNPESFEKLIHSKGFKMIQQGRMNVNVLSSVRPMDKVDDDYFYNLFEAKEQDFNAKYESSTALKAYDKDMLFKIIDLDPAKQDEVLNYIEKAKDPRLMKTLIEKRINKIVEKQEEIDSTNSFETPDAAQKRKENAIELIRIASRSPEIINKVLKFNGSSVDALTSFADTELSVRLTPREKESVYALFNDAQQKYKNIYITDVQAALKYLEKSHDFDLLKQLTSSKQDFRYSLILKSVTQNNVDLLKNALKNIGGKVSVSQLSMLEAAKDYPEMKDFRSEVAQGILQTIDEVCRNSKTNVLNKIKGLKDELKLELDRIKNDETLSIEQKASASNKAFSNMYRQMSIISGEIYVETANRKGLVEIKLKDPAKYERLKESGILDMVDSGELDSSILKHLNVNSDLTPEVYADLEAVKNGESIIPEFKTGTTIPYAFSRTKVGDAVAIGDKMYINDGNNLVEWKMTKEKYLELFPPVKRFLTQQRALGDCYFVSSLTNSMYNPQARVGIYQSFEQNGNDISVTIKDYNEYGGTKTYKDSKIDLDNRRLHVAGAKGIQMYEQTYAKVALRDFRQDTTPMTDDKDIVVTMQRIPGGQPSNAMTEMHSLGVTGYYNEVPNDFKTGSIGIRNITQEKLATLLDRFSNQDNTLIGFNTNPKPNAKAESTLDSKYNLVSSHAYIIRGYNQEKGTVIINNPHNSGTNTEVPIDVLAKHMSMFNISVLNDEPTLLKVSNDSNFDSVKTSVKGSAEDLATTNESDTSKTPELTREYLSSLKEISFGGAMESNRFSPEEIEKVLELSKQNPKLVKYLIDATEMDYSSSFEGTEVTRFDYDDIVRIVDYAKENPELITRLLEYRDESPFSRKLTARFSFPEIKAIADLAKEKPELIDTLLELKHNDSSYVMNSNTIIDIATNENLSKNAITQIKSFSNRNYGGWDIVNNLTKSNVEEAIEALRKSYTYEDLAPLTSVQNKFLDALLDLTKDSPIAIDVLTSSGVAKSLRELKPEHYSKVLSFIEKFPNSVDRLNYIFRRLNSDESTEMEEFLRSSSYMDEMKRNSAGKYQKELLEMFSPENLSDESIESLLKLSATKEDFLNAIKKMSKSTFKLAYERPNQYLSGIDTKYTDPVNGKLPELPESVLISQRNQIKKFFIENMDSLVRLLKYVDTDTVSHMMDRRTDLFEENMEKLNGISDENYELLSKALQCKSSVSGKQLSPKEKMQLTQIMFILNEAKIDTSSLKAEVEKGSVDINNSKTTIQNAVLKAAGVDVTDASIPAEKKQFNPEYAYLALMNQSETFENSIADKIERIKPKMMERISLLRNDRELLRQEIERSETMMDYVPESMKKINIELLDMVKNIDKHSDEEILSKMLATVNAALKLSQEITGRNGLFTVINAATTGNFKEFINDTSNKYGQANANTAQIFKDNGLDYNQWLNPSVDDVKLNVAGKDMSIRLWDRNPQEDLFMGNKTTCCTAIGTGGNAAATPLYLLNTSYNVAMLHDAKGNVVGMSRVFMTNIDGKPSLTMDNIELNKTYIKGMSAEERTQIRDGFFEYMNRYAAKITGDNNSQVYFCSGDIGDRFSTIDLKPTKKTVDFIGDFSDEQVYVNAKECSWIDPKKLIDVGKIPWYIVPRK